MKKGFFAIQRNMEYPQHELGGIIMTILAFNLFANTTWGICYENRKTPLGNSE
jgi:hypothetical protein